MAVGNKMGGVCKNDSQILIENQNPQESSPLRQG